MEFKGTQGEWKLSELKTFGRQMVDLGDFNGCIDVWYHSGESMTKEEAKANAQLIAAAPEMLEMLICLAKNTANKNEYEKIEELIKKATTL